MKLVAGIMCAAALSACDDGVGEPPSGGGDQQRERGFTLRIDNVAPWTVLKAGSQRLRTNGIDGIAAPSEAFEIRFSAGPGQNVSFATMLFQSNDWLFAPEPEGIPLYVNGVATAGDVTHLVKLWDVGTEADQEPGVGDAVGSRQLTRDAGAPDRHHLIRAVGQSVVLADGRTFAVPPVASMIRVTLTPGADRQFVLRIENVSTASTLQTSAGSMAIGVSPVAWAMHRVPEVLFGDGKPVNVSGLETLAESGQPDALGTTLRYQRGVAATLSPGVFIVHRADAPLFSLGKPDVGVGLEALAEDGDEVPLLAWMGSGGAGGAPGDAVELGAFQAPVGASSPTSPAAPGQSFEMRFRASPGDALSIATGLGAANDWFFAPAPTGIALYLGTLPRWGDITTEIQLYDLGTELDEELDVGPNTAVHQTAPNTGRIDRVREVRAVTVERYEVPVIHHLRVTLTPDDGDLE